MYEKCYYASDVLNGPAINLLFCCYIILYWEKVTFYEKFSHSLTLETQTVWKILAFQCYWWKYQNPEIYLNFHKVQLKWKISNIWQDPNSELPSRNYLAHQQIKASYTRNIQTYTFAVFQECSSCDGHLEMVQHNFFSDTSQPETWCWKICIVSGYLAVLWGYTVYNVEWVEVCKISEAFWAKRYCKMNDLFCPSFVGLKTCC